MTLLFISFVAGILTVLAPCILPLLPVIIGGSITSGENKHRSYVIIGSLIISIVVFTLLLKWSTVFVMVPPYVWNILSGGILILFSLSLLFPDAWSLLPLVGTLNNNSNKLLGTGYQKKTIVGDMIVGAALGPVFSSCSPTYFVILATVLPQNLSVGIVYLFAYALGLGIVLLLIAILGQRLVGKLDNIADPKGWFKRGLGILFLLVGIFIATGIDKQIEASLINHGFTGLSSVEQNILNIGK